MISETINIRLKPLARSSLAALGAILLALALLWTRAPLLPLSSYDQRFYLGIARDLIDTGRFTDGFMFGEPGPDGERPSGMRFPPLYPALLAAAADLEPAFRTGMECVVDYGPSLSDAPCADTARLMRGVQFAMLAGFYLMLWWSARLVCGRLPAAWLALGIGLLAAPILLRSVNLLMTETASLALSTAATVAALAAWQSDRPRRYVALCGLLLGLLALTRPSFLYLFLGIAICGALAVAFGWLTPRKRAALLLCLFAAGFVVPVGPWIARNAIVLGRPALTFGYDSHTLVQRISFDSMTWREYALSYVCWLPDGNGLGQILAGHGACDRFQFNEHPDSFYSIGLGPLMAQTLQAAGWDHHLRYLLTHYILREPLKHLLVTVPLALRGAWIDHYWGLLLGAACFAFTLRAVPRRNVPFLILAAPAWFMLVFNAGVAVNVERYNLMLIPPYSVSGAMLTEWMLARRRHGSAQRASAFTASG